MNINREDTGDLTATIQIDIEQDDYQEKVDDVLRDYRRKANIPGFRPGKVPFGMIKKMYGRTVLADEINKILGDALDNYIKENDINLIGQPLANAEKSQQIDFDQQKDFSFFFDIGITPEFEVDLSDKVKINYYTIEVDKKMLDNHINDILMRHGKHEKVEEAEEGDLLKGKIEELDDDGNKKENGIVNDTTISLAYIKDKSIKERITGIKTGESVRFNPLTATGNAVETATMLGIKKEEAESLTSEFEFTAEEIIRLIPAELNEEFYKHMYPNDEIKNEKEFRERAARDVSRGFIPDCDRQFMKDVVDRLIEKTEIPLPDEFVKRLLKETNQGEVKDEDIDRDYDNYAKSLRWQLIENKIIKENDIQVKEDEIKSYIKNYFSASFQQSHGHDHDHGHPEEITPEQDQYLDQLASGVMQNNEEVNKINDYLYNNKLRDLFRSKLKVSEKNISYEDFVKLASDNK